MVSNSIYTLHPLFIKPLHYPGPILFARGELAFRSFNLDTDLDLIYQWVNMDYTLKYWQLDGSRERVLDTYYNIQRNSNGHSFIGLLNGKPICQFDVYRVLADEIRQFVTADEDDCGFHLLMGPRDKMIPGLSLQIVNTFLDYYFSFPQARKMYAEPDISNLRSNYLLQRAGFEFIEAITMSYKTANLFCLTREQFLSTTK
jgi:acetyl CoA:N6-hydroxylysine acetyl transferase